jgi:hypothetical protein
MASHVQSVLSPSISAKLSALKTGLGHKNSDRDLAEILTELSALPANCVVRASREIAVKACLGWWQPQKRSFRVVVGNPSDFNWWSSKGPPLFKRPSNEALSEQELMVKNHDYAWLFLFHPSGYVREAALHAVSEPPTSPFFFSVLAWRLNDWVPAVRKAAERCAERVLNRTAPEVAAKAAQYLLDRRLVWGRWSDEPKVLDASFSRDDVITALALQLQEGRTGPLATCLRNALRYPTVDGHLPRLAAAAVQPLVRAVAYQCLIFGKASWCVGFEWVWIDKAYGVRKRVPALETRDVRRIRPAVDLIREAAHDESPFVRRVAADALIAARSQLPDEAALIAHLANDQSSAIRSRADFMLRHPPLRQS